MLTIKSVTSKLEQLCKAELGPRFFDYEPFEIAQILYDLDLDRDTYVETVNTSGGWRKSKQEIIDKMIIIIGQKGLIIDYKG